jgi:hypothetical protein
MNVLNSPMTQVGYAATGARQAFVPGAMESLGYTINEIGTSVEQISARLCSVLRSDPPSQPTNKGESLAASAPLAQSIDDRTAQLRAINRILQDLLDRIEL